MLVWQAPTRRMHPRIPQRVIDEAVEADPASAQAEYGAQFRTDVESFVLREAVAACVTSKVLERPPEPGHCHFGFVDPSGGSADDMAIAISHLDYNRDTVVIDAIRWFKPPFSPEIVVQDFARVLKTYNVSTIVGDRYGGEWPREQFSKFGITYEPSSKTKSELYTDLLPLINSARIALLDQAKAINQLLALERRTARGGKDSIDHPAGAHDDLVNVVAGAASLAAAEQVDVSMAWVSGGPKIDVAEEARQWRVTRLMQHIGLYG